MTFLELLHELNCLDVDLVSNCERLGFSPRERVSPELANEIRQHKPALLEYLRTGEIVLSSSASVKDVRLALSLVNQKTETTNA